MATAPPGPTLPGQKALLARLTGLGADTLVISGERLGPLASRLIHLPLPGIGDDDLYTPIPYIIPAQIFAALLAEAKGLTPDQPRSLSKVTKTV